MTNCSNVHCRKRIRDKAQRYYLWNNQIICKSCHLALPSHSFTKEEKEQVEKIIKDEDNIYIGRFD